MVLGKAAPRQSEICLSLECKAWQEVGLKIWSGSYGSYSSRRKTWCKLKHNPQGFTDFRNRRFPVPVASPLLGWRASHWDDPTLAVPPASKISLCKSAEISENLWILGVNLGNLLQAPLQSLTDPSPFRSAFLTALRSWTIQGAKKMGPTGPRARASQVVFLAPRQLDQTKKQTIQAREIGKWFATGLVGFYSVFSGVASCYNSEILGENRKWKWRCDHHMRGLDTRFSRDENHEICGDLTNSSMIPVLGALKKLDPVWSSGRSLFIALSRQTIRASAVALVSSLSKKSPFLPQNDHEITGKNMMTIVTLMTTGVVVRLWVLSHLM